MHCPKCGQQQISEETRFCSRCGFLLTGIAEVVANGGVVPGSVVATAKSSPRKRGLKQGLFIFLLTFLVVPIVSIITIALNAEPIAVAISAILLIMGGLLRMVYALMFESSVPGESTLEEKLLAASPHSFKPHSTQNALPPQQSTPVSDYVSPAAGAWRDTNELERHPSSVTDHTTKLLEKERDN